MNTTIHVGDTPPIAEGFADFFDGRHAISRRADVGIVDTANGPELIIAAPGQDWLHWGLADIRGVPDQADRDELVLAHAADPVARLIVRDPDLCRILAARCPSLSRRPPVRGKGRLALWAFAAVGSVALIIFVLVPVMANQLAEYLPPKGERALGETTFEQIRTALDETGDVAAGDLRPLGWRGCACQDRGAADPTARSAVSGRLVCAGS